MSLARALTKLPTDADTEATIRDLLLFFVHHKNEWLDLDIISRRTGYGVATLEAILRAFKESYILKSDGGDPPQYRYTGDISLSVEIDSYVRRVRAHRTYVQSNVAKFRERYSAY